MKRNKKWIFFFKQTLESGWKKRQGEKNRHFDFDFWEMDPLISVQKSSQKRTFSWRWLKFIAIAVFKENKILWFGSKNISSIEGNKSCMRLLSQTDKINWKKKRVKSINCNCFDSVSGCFQALLLDTPGETYNDVIMIIQEGTQYFK